MKCRNVAINGSGARFTGGVSLFINPPSAETEILWDNLINTIIADTLAPRVARPWAAMVLTMQNKRTPVVHEEGFQLSTPSQSWKIIEIVNIFIFIPGPNITNASEKRI